MLLTIIQVIIPFDIKELSSIWHFLKKDFHNFIDILNFLDIN